MRTTEWNHGVVSTANYAESVVQSAGRLVGVAVSLSAVVFLAGAESYQQAFYTLWLGSPFDGQQRLADMAMYLYLNTSFGTAQNGSIYIPLDTNIVGGQVLSHSMGIASGYAQANIVLYWE